MRKRLLVFTVSALAALALAAPGAADHNAGPCNTQEGAGHSEFAEHHIAPLAQSGGLGDGGHKPGMHGGMSACDPSQNRP
jgi:hypothetical protein